MAKIIKTITPKYINTKQTTTADKDYLSIKTEDETYYAVWKPELFEFFNVDVPIRVKVEEVETAEGLKFNNIVGIAEEPLFKEEGRKTEKKENKEEKKKKEIIIEKPTIANKTFCLVKACDIIIAFIQRGDKDKIKKDKVAEEIKKLYKELLKLFKE